MNARANNPLSNIKAYQHIFEEHAINAAFLWLLRSQVVYTSTVYNQESINELDNRIAGHLRGLQGAGELGWKIALKQLKLEEPGEVFVAAVLAFKSGDESRIKQVCEASLLNEAMMPGLVSALGWIDVTTAQNWIERFLKVANPHYRYLGIAACSIRRLDPGPLLVKILQDDAILQHSRLYARCLRLIGELKRQDLLPALNQAVDAEDDEVRFWANWSSVLLGKTSSKEKLKPYVMEHPGYQDKALQAILASSATEEARGWIDQIARDPERQRLVIKATGLLGEPVVVPWLIQHMNHASTARIAGLSFSLITGIDIEEEKLDKDVEVEFIDNEGTDIEDDAENEDSELPWPDPQKLILFWKENANRFKEGSRSFLGEPVGPEQLKRVIKQGNQLQRQAAAIKLAVLELEQVMDNIATPQVTH